MSLKPQAVRDTATDQNFRQIAQQFPIQAQNLADSVKELSPQLQTAGSHKEAFGSFTVTWAGGTNFSPVKEVEHGLEAVPADVHLNVTGTNIAAFLPPNVWLSTDPTSTLLKIQAWANGLVTAGKTATVYWRAIT